MRIKPGVRFASPEMAMCTALFIVRDVYAEFGVECVVTGGVEEHQHPSKHVYGGALDFRTRDLRPERRRDLADEIAVRLSDGFDVVLESDHIHVEWDSRD